MIRIYAFLITAWLVVCCSFTAHAQPPTFTITAPVPSIEVGDTVITDMIVTDFINTSAYQYSINWDAGILEFVEILDLNLAGLFLPPSPNSFNTSPALVDSGRLPCLWSEPGAQPLTLMDGTRIFSIKFVAIAPGDPNLRPGNDPTAGNTIYEDMNGDLQEAAPGMVASDLIVTGPGGGPAACDTITGLGVVASSDTVATGAQTCLNVSVCGFTDVVGFSYTMQFDPNLLSFDSLTNFNLAQLDNGSFGTTNASNGQITFAWIDSTGTGISVPDETIIYDICLTAIGAGGTVDTLDFNSSLTNLGAEDPMGNPIPVTPVSGTIDITGSATGALTVDAGEASGMQSDQVCLDMYVENFVDMLSLQYTMEWDPAVIEFDTILDPNNFFDGMVASSFNTSAALVDAGNLTMLWTSPNNGTTPVTLPDSSVIYQVCYNIIGEGGTSSTVTFNGDLTDITSFRSDGGGGEDEVPVVPISGNVNVIGSGTFTLLMGDSTICPGDTICMPVVVRGANDLLSLQFSLNWTDTILSYIGVEDNILPPSTTLGETGVSMGEFAFQWFDFNFIQPSYPDNTNIFNVCFEAVGDSGESSNIDYTDDPTLIEVSDHATGMALPYFVNGGSITIDDAACAGTPVPIISASTVTDVLCFGDSTGVVDITVSDGTPTYTYSWTGPDGFTSTDEDLNGVPVGTYDVTVTDSNSQTVTGSFMVSQPTAALTVSGTSTDSQCDTNDGTIDLTVAGGTPGYTFAWDNVAATGEDPSGLAAGTYCVTVTDANNCTAETCVTVNNPDGPAITGTVTDETCNGANDGSIDLTVTGGTPAYTFAWNSTAATGEDPTMLPDGTYTVTVTDMAGCSSTASFTVDPGVEITISTFQVNESCGASNGSINLTINGGTPGYTFEWDNAAATGEDPTGLAAGTYCVTVTDANNCTGTTCLTLSGTTAPVVTGTVTDASCSGQADGAISLNVTGGMAGFSYAWDNAAATGDNPTGLLSGTYSVTVTDANNCTGTNSFTINEGASIVVGGTATDLTCNGAGDGSINVTVSGGMAAYTFAWDNASASGQNPSGLEAGTYNLTVTDANNCSSTASYVINEPTAITASATATDISCNGAGDGSIAVTVGGGTTPYSYAWNNAAASGQNPSGLGPNTYIVTVTDANLCTTTASALVSEPAAIVVNATVTDEIIVDDGAIDLTVTGGAGGFTYAWSNGLPAQEDQTGLAPNTYTVTVTDATGCSTINSFAVNAADSPIITFLVTDASCNGGNDGIIDVTVTGGTPTYSYDWDFIPGPGPEPQDVASLAAGTYTVTVTDAAAATAVQVITVGEPTAIVVTVNNITPISCQGETDGAISVGAAGGTGNLSFDWGAPIGITSNPNSLGAGTYTVTVNDENMCQQTQVVVLEDPTLVSVSIDQVDHLDCANSPTGAISITPSGGTPPYQNFVWANTDSNTNIAFSEDVTGLLGGNYAVTFQDANGCMFTSDAITIIEPTLISSGATITDIDCFGDFNGAIDLQVNGGTPGYTFDWDNGASTEDLTDLSGGDYSVTITDANGCTLEDGPFNVTEPGALDVNFNVTNAGVTNDNGQIDLMVLGGTAEYSYNWLLGPSQTLSSSEDLFGLQAGNYYVTVIDANGCVTNDSTLVAGLIVSDGTVQHVSCFDGSDGAIDLFVQGGVQPLLFDWQGPSFSSQVEDIGALATGTYTVTITDGNGGTATNTFIVNEPAPLEVVNISITDESGAGCNGSVDLSVTGGTGAYSFQWSNGASSEDVTDLCKGTYSVSVLDANGCMLPIADIEVQPAPLVLSMTDMESVSCNGGSDGSACATIFGGCGPYTFVLSNGEQVVSLDGQNICFDDLAAGTYTLTITDNGTPAQSLSEDFEISESEAIEINVVSISGSTNDVNCNGSINIDVSGGSPGYTYQWSNGASSEDVSGLCPELSPYCVTVTDSEGCIQELCDLVIADLPEELSITFDKADISCFGDCDGLINIVIEGGTGPYSYNWSDGPATEDRSGLCAGDYGLTVTDADGNDITIGGISITSPASALEASGVVTDPIGAATNGQINLSAVGGWTPYTYGWSGPNGFSSNSMDVVGLGAGQYSVTITDANGCESLQSFTVVGMSLNVAAQITTPTCFGDSDGSIALTISGGAEPFTYSWSDGQTGSTAAFLTVGEYSVTITGSNGLVTEYQTTLNQPAELLVAASSPADGAVEATVNGGTPGYGYQWNTIDGDNTQLVENLSAGLYAVLVTDAKGCIATANVEISGEDPECTLIRTIITPNQDGKNEIFIIGCADNFKDNSLEIYNRWGQLVWQGNNYSNDWAGTKIDGTALPEDGYFYVFEYRDSTGELKQIKGAITLLY